MDMEDVFTSSAGGRIYNGDSLDLYDTWRSCKGSPVVIVSDGAYGISGFPGDPASPGELTDWYLPHVEKWSEHAGNFTTLWFWNTEIGWAHVHPLLEANGWEYVHANIWNKGKSHVAGRVNTATARTFPVVTELCAMYVRVTEISPYDSTMQEWLRSEWSRSGLTLDDANKACGVAAAASRKYLTADSMWYPPPFDMFERLHDYANLHGNPDGAPYLEISKLEYDKNIREYRESCNLLRSKFNLPFGYTNVWDVPALHGEERLKSKDLGAKSAHLNQKPQEIMDLIIRASTDKGDVVWEPFGGLFSASLSANNLGRVPFAAEIDPEYFRIGVSRFSDGFETSENCIKNRTVRRLF